MRSFHAAVVGAVLAASAALPATAAPALPFLDSGPLADFLNGFREQAIPRETVAWHGPDKPGTIIVSTGQRRLYYVLGHGRAIRYGVGVGRQGFSWSGTRRCR